MMYLESRHILILGLGESGLAMARWCRREGASVRVADTRANPPKLAVLKAEFPDADIRLGAFTFELLAGIDLIAISPGLAPHAQPQRVIVDTARERGIVAQGEIEFFAQKLVALKQERGYAPRVVAITGTNGKTTVTRLVGKLAARSGFATRVAGNIGPAALDALSDALAAEASGGALPEVWVLEVSSFQLATTTSFAPDVATVLNITQDHLDWHGDLAAYTAAKARVFGPNTIRVINRDDARVRRMSEAGAIVLTFGLTAPPDAQGFGVVIEKNHDRPVRWLACAESLGGRDFRNEIAQVALSATPRSASKTLSKAASKSTVKPKAIVREPLAVARLMPTDALRIRGDHNIANALAALALGRAIGLPLAAMLHALSEYRGEPHRVALVAHIAGVDYVDDSKGTNVGATVAALEGLGKKIVLIAGGDGKGQDFKPLAAPVARHARGVFLIGKDRDALRCALAATGVALVDCATLEDAVVAAARIAHVGDAVLLSPACASLDMFRDYKHRADVFAAAVHRLAEEASQPC